MDHPRFEPVKGTPEDAHRHYNGGRLVSLVLSLADRYDRGDGPGGPVRRWARRTLSAILVALSVAPAAARPGAPEGNAEAEARGVPAAPPQVPADAQQPMASASPMKLSATTSHSRSALRSRL